MFNQMYAELICYDFALLLRQLILRILLSVLIIEPFQQVFEGKFERRNVFKRVELENIFWRWLFLKTGLNVEKLLVDSEACHLKRQIVNGAGTVADLVLQDIVLEKLSALGLFLFWFESHFW